MLLDRDNIRDERISVSQKLISKFPTIDLYSRLLDAHLYIFKRWVLDVLIQRKSLSSIKEDLLPLLIKSQLDSTKVFDSEENGIP